MRRHRRGILLFIYLMLLALTIVLVAQTSGATTECEYRNTPSPTSSPSPKGVWRPVYNNTGLYLKTSYSSGKFSYEFCHPWQPN